MRDWWENFAEWMPLLRRFSIIIGIFVFFVLVLAKRVGFSMKSLHERKRRFM
jgi:hypothetical protein